MSKSLFEMMTHAPWCVTIIAAFVVFLGLKFIIPTMLKGHVLFSGVAMLVSGIAPWIALLCLFCGAVLSCSTWRRRESLTGQTSVSTIRKLSWRSLEDIVAEVYRREGYFVTESPGPGSDGGVDLIARKDGETILIQCKQWKARKVGVGTIIEMFGLLNAEGANEVHIASSGYYTDEAIEFARNKPIRLINGSMLASMADRVQPGKAPSLNRPGLCPKCGSSMVLRTATKGPAEGQQFWGCENFPDCRGFKLLE